MTTGGVQFARYAYPPNALGYCGPDDHPALFEYGSAAAVDGGLVALAREFEGAWPYLELIASHANRYPLDREVVEAYWVGNGLLDLVDRAALGNDLRDRFQGRASTSWDAVADAVEMGAKPSHAFHVFCVYPWVGLMRTGIVDQPLHVLDNCRIRWGEILELSGDDVRVRTRPLVLEGSRLAMGPETTQWAVWASRGQSLGPSLSEGDPVALHWNWVCERLDHRSLARLRRETVAAVKLANRTLARPRTGILT